MFFLYWGGGSCVVAKCFQWIVNNLDIIGSYLITIFSIGVTLNSTQKSKILEKRLKTMTWEEVIIAINCLYKKMKKDGFEPDIIIAPGARGAILAELLLDKLSHDIPIYTGVSLLGEGTNMNDNFTNSNEYEKINIRDDWDIFIPELVFCIKSDKKVLIIDDFTIAGDFPRELKNKFLQNGFSKNQVKTMYLIITYAVKESKKEPDYYYKVAESQEYYFPWGRANTG